MKYTVKFKTKWHDTDINRVVRTTQIQMYMQEAANLQCVEYGMALDTLRDEKGLAFILGSMLIDIKKPIFAFEEIEVRTWCRKAHGYSFVRYFDIVRDNEVIAQASSMWALLDIHNKKMVRPDSSMDEHFPFDEEIPQENLPKKARISKDTPLCEVGKRKIMYSDLDYNMHMNNTKYPDMICDFLPDMKNKRVARLSMTYLKEAAYGDVLGVHVCENVTNENGLETFIVRTTNDEGKACLEAVIGLEEIKNN